MSARLREIARRTEEIVARGGYATDGGRWVEIGDRVRASVAGTRGYGPEPVRDLPPADASFDGTVFEVTSEDSLAAARRLLGPGTGTGAGPAGTGPAGAVAVLNFASARNPGGGYLNGAQAQEEALCRASALYTTLLAVPGHYAAHREDRSPLYTDRVVHSPGVPVFRDERGRLLEEPFEVGFLTCPAPNAGVVARNSPSLGDRVPEVLRVRGGRVLEVAALHGYRRLVLGAWGCGVFRNDPRDVAAAFAHHLREGGRFAGRFERVVFAVLDRRADSPVRAAFAEVFAP